MQGRGTEAGEKIAHGKFSRRDQGDLAHPCPSPLGYRPWRVAAMSGAQCGPDAKGEAPLGKRCGLSSALPGLPPGPMGLASSAARFLLIFSLIFWGHSYQSSCGDLGA